MLVIVFILEREYVINHYLCNSTDVNSFVKLVKDILLSLWCHLTKYTNSIAQELIGIVFIGLSLHVIPKRVAQRCRIR